MEEERVVFETGPSLWFTILINPFPFLLILICIVGLVLQQQSSSPTWVSFFVILLFVLIAGSIKLTSVRRFIISCTLTILCCVVVFTGVFPLWGFSIVAIFVMILNILYCLHKIWTTKLEITNKHVNYYRKRRILFSDNQSFPHKNVSAVGVKDNPLEAFFGIGTLILTNTSGNKDIIHEVPHVNTVAEIVKRYITKPPRQVMRRRMRRHDA